MPMLTRFAWPPEMPFTAAEPILTSRHGSSARASITAITAWGGARQIKFQARKKNKRHVFRFVQRNAPAASSRATRSWALQGTSSDPGQVGRESLRSNHGFNDCTHASVPRCTEAFPPRSKCPGGCRTAQHLQTTRVSRGCEWVCGNAQPVKRRRNARDGLMPEKSTSPVVSPTVLRPASKSRSVVLPDPEGPMSATEVGEAPRVRWRTKTTTRYAVRSVNHEGRTHLARVHETGDILE